MHLTTLRVENKRIFIAVGKQDVVASCFSLLIIYIGMRAKYVLLRKKWGSTQKKLSLVFHVS